MRSHSCPNCGKTVQLSSDVRGPSVKCPSCQTRFTVETRARAAPPPRGPEPEVFVMVDEPGPGTSPRGSAEDESRPARKRRRKKKASPGKAIPWGWVGAGGAILLLLLVSLIGWLLSGPGKGKAVNVSREPEDSPHRLAESSLPPQPRSWKVTPDGVERAANLRSAFPVPAGAVEAVLFSAPGSAQAGVLALPVAEVKKVFATGRLDGKPERSLEWVRYDLRSLDPVARLPLTGSYPIGGLVPNPIVDTRNPYPGMPRVLADLSPSGKTLAIVTTANVIETWSSTGKRVGELRPLEAGATVEWLGLIDDSRVLVLSGGRLALREFPSGRTVHRSETGFSKPVVLSPGRKCAVALTRGGFTWLGTSDGAVGGTLPLPAAAELGDQPELAVSLDGQKLAAVLPLRAGDSGKRLGLKSERRLVVAWDVATGRATDGVIVTPEQMAARRPHILAWCGPRHLLLGGTHLLDLDLSTVVWDYVIKQYTRTARTSPDGRVWYTAGDKVEEITKHFKGSKLSGEDTSFGHFLAAWTAPHAEVTKRLEAGRRGFVWCPGTAVRIQVEGEDGGTRQAAAEKLAESMARSGIRVDPAAPAALRLRFNAPKTGEEHGRVLKRESAGPYKPGWQKVTVEVKNMTHVTAKLDVINEKGSVCVEGNVVGASEQGTDRAAARAAREKLVDRLAQPGILRLPAVSLLDENYHRILLPSRSGIGIDGVQTPAPQDVR